MGTRRRAETAVRTAGDVSNRFGAALFVPHARPAAACFLAPYSTGHTPHDGAWGLWGNREPVESGAAGAYLPFAAVRIEQPSQAAGPPGMSMRGLALSISVMGAKTETMAL